MSFYWIADKVNGDAKIPITCKPTAGGDEGAAHWERSSPANLSIGQDNSKHLNR